jgi:hypothetical protein
MKRSRADAAQRLDEVEQLLAQGGTVPQVQRALCKRWGISVRQANRYIEQVHAKWERLGPRARLVAMQQAIFRKAITGGKLPSAVAALDRLMREAGNTAALERYRAVGELPSDPLESVRWVQRLLCVAAQEVVEDASLDPRARREELRRTARCVAALVPTDELYDARRRVEEDQRQLADETPPVRLHVATRGTKSLRAETPRARSARREVQPDSD